MPAPQSTQPILPAASLYRTVMFCAASSIPFRLTPSYRLTAASPCPYSALFHPGMPAPQSTQPILPAASLYRTVMFCAASSIPFRLTPSYRLTAASPCPYSALFHSGMPAPNLPDLPSRPPVGAAMLCSSRLRSIPLRLTPAYRLTAANPCRFILLCFIPARTALLCYQPTLHRSRSIWFIYYNQKKHAQHISPLCYARHPIKQPTDAAGKHFPTEYPTPHDTQIYISRIRPRSTGYRSAPPVGCKTAARAIGRDSEDTLPLYGRNRIVMR